MSKGVKTDGGLVVLTKPNFHHSETFAYTGHKHVANENPVTPGNVGFHPVTGSPGKVKVEGDTSDEHEPDDNLINAPGDDVTKCPDPGSGPKVGAEPS